MLDNPNPNWENRGIDKTAAPPSTILEEVASTRRGGLQPPDKMNGCLRDTSEGVYLSLKVQPRASRNLIGPLLGDELKISVTAPPVDSAANEAILEYLSELLDVPKRNLQLVRGQTSRRKTVFIRGGKLATVAQKLGLR